MKNLARSIAVLVFFFCFLHAPVVHAATQGSLAGYWKLDESSGTTALDASGAGNDGTYGGSPTASTSVPTTSFPDTHSLSFNGTSDIVTIAAPTGLNGGTSARTLTAWIKPEALTSTAIPVAYGTCAFEDGAHDGQAFGFFIDPNNNNDLHFWGCGSADGDTNTSVPDNQWTNIVITYNGTSVIVYINGTAVGGFSRTLSAATNPYLQIGGADHIDSTAKYFHGLIDDVRYYNRALSSTEVAELAAGDNTTATWTGATDYNYATASNWDIDATPDAYTNIVVPKAASSLRWPSLQSNTGLANLDDQGLFYLGDYNLTFNDNGTFSNTGIFQLNGGQTLTNFKNDTDSGTVTYSGPSTYTSLPTGDSYYNLTFDKGTGTGTWTLPNGTTLDIANDFSLKNGVTFNAGSSTINVGGDWLDSTDSTFDAGTGAVVLTGTNQTVTGNNAFYDLRKTVQASDAQNADKLNFGIGETQTITHDLSLIGRSNNLLALLSGTVGSTWNIDATGAAVDLRNIYVQDSDNVGSNTLTATIDGDRNTNWTFDNTAPTIESTTPADDASGVAPGSDLVITFSEPVTAETGTVTVKRSSDNSTVATFDVASDVSGSGTDEITINPPNDLEHGTEYYVTIASGAFADATGNEFAGISDATTWNFTTAAAPAPAADSASGNGMIYTGPASALPGYVAPRPQIINPDGTITYLDATSTGGAVNTITPTDSTPNLSNATTTPYHFTRDLERGMTGSDVLALQRYLNAHGFTLAQSGAGSPGNETEYFGMLTESALVKFQEAHAAQILTPLNLDHGTGYFGSATRAFIADDK